MIERYYSDLQDYLQKGKVLVVYGARRVGKTTLLKRFLEKSSYKYKLVSGDNITVREVLGSEDFNKIAEFCEGYELIAIDEAQTIQNIGRGLKIIVDNHPDIIVIATGSSSFDLANEVGEPLVGRKKMITLFPVGQIELVNNYNKSELAGNLEEYLRFGTYPEVLNLNGVMQKTEYLLEITGSYLYRDILAYRDIRHSRVIHKLVKLLAFQVGGQVSYNDLSKDLAVDVKTVDKYIDLLEKTFVIKRLQGFSRNLRKEISKKHKYYFLDLGVRNAVINNFNDLSNRADIGQLWENFLFIERVKRNEYKRCYANLYYWRTYDKKEVDFVEERDGGLCAFEAKWKKGSQRGLKEFVSHYSDAESMVVDRDNYLDFVT